LTGYEIIDAKGILVDSGELKESGIDISNLPEGNYSLILKLKAGRISKQFSKTH
jgi:hypothetical protein